jgi:hydrogenase expression/formation protein HypE
MTKTAGLEGASILATERKSMLREKGIPTAVLKTASGFQEQISIVDEALLSTKIRGVHAMHDPTEGGVSNGLWEMAEASGLGIEVWGDEIPIASQTRAICFALGLDPLRLMSSGALLLAVTPSEFVMVRKALSRHRIGVTEIGTLRQRDKGRILIRHGRKETLKAVSRDVLYQII